MDEQCRIERKVDSLMDSIRDMKSDVSLNRFIGFLAWALTFFIFVTSCTLLDRRFDRIDDRLSTQQTGN